MLCTLITANIIDNNSHLRYRFVVKSMTDFKLSLFSRCVGPMLTYESSDFHCHEWWFVSMAKEET
ncbi:hypothetical protein VCRLGP8_1430380 [Vibrio crassostreae]|nr:hypothetical protein VCRLGP7_200383 [Vibrio crassostreae]CDT20272.1 hypothetical protein VCRLGP8_1430380 [Vibrio crassostreae]CDT62242.1 hypothetical protein VCRLGP107_760379 [Vibrio crassostreae]